MADQAIAKAEPLDLTALMVSEEVKKQLQAEKNALVAEANSMAVTTNDEYVAAGEFVKKCAIHDKKIHGMFDKLVQTANTLHKGLTGLRTSLMVSPEARTNHDASMIVRQKMSTYTREVERLRRVEEARRTQEAQKQAVESRLNQAVIVLFSESGTPTAVLDGTSVTCLRTGAASALASKYLSREDCRNLLIIGTVRWLPRWPPPTAR